MPCTSVGTIRGDSAALPAGRRSRSSATSPHADQRRDHALRLDAAAMRSFARWVAFLTRCWRTAIGAPRLFVWFTLCSARQRALRGVPDFVQRPRDPAPSSFARPLSALAFWCCVFVSSHCLHCLFACLFVAPGEFVNFYFSFPRTA
jgi:hypothetical protein